MNFIYSLMNSISRWAQKKNVSPRTKAGFYGVLSKVFSFLGNLGPRKN